MVKAKQSPAPRGSWVFFQGVEFLMSKRKLRGDRVESPVRALVEELEGRRLLAVALMNSPQPLAMASTSDGAVPLAEQPFIASSNPTNGTVNVPRFQFISLNVHLISAASGVDPATVNLNTVKLARASDNQTVNSNLTVDAAGGNITITPNALLAANTAYKVTVTSGLKDTSGNAFIPFTMNFTTGLQVPAQDTNIVFEKFSQSTSTNRPYSALAWGPDNKLYAGTLTGEILRFSIGGDGTLGAPEVFNVVNDNNTEARFVIGLEFDPASTAQNPILWVSHSVATDLQIPEAPDWTGKISRLSGSNFSTYQDYVVGLPRSVRDHLTNQIHFGPDGALYWSQPSMNAMGGADIAWVREDHPLSGAVLRLDISKVTSAPVDVKTPDGGGSYNPAAPNAPVTVYATGVRNGYDFVWHSNGHLYMPANGSAAGGDLLAGHNGVPPYQANVQETMHDYVFDVVPGGYYGQPNKTRDELIMNGGNPTAGVDRNEVVSYPVGTQPEANYRYDALDLGKNYAPTGVIEYKNTSNFGGKLAGRMLMLRYSGGDDVFILTPSADGKSVSGINGLGLDGLNDPTEIIEDPNTGNLYVCELGTQNSGQPTNRIYLFKPTTMPALQKLQLINADIGNSAGALRARGTYNLADIGTHNLSVRALYQFSPGSVMFDIDGQQHTENFTPFALLGENQDGSYTAWNPTPGLHTLTVTPFTGANGTGTAGPSQSLIFWFIDESKPIRDFISFQPVDTPRVPGYKPDWGRLYGARGTGLTYGWNKNAQYLTYDRNSPISPDQRFDTGVSMGSRTWDLAVPNGTYSVFLLGGDPTDTGTYNIAVEGVPTLVGTTTTSNPFLGKTVQVTVTDNTLSVSPLAGSFNHKLAFIQVVST
jgi:glucose/arabinose dehydrogenase